MLKFYRIYYKTIVKGYCIDSKIAKMVTEKTPHNEKIVFTWDNLNGIYQKYGFQLGFNIYNMRRGRRISFWKMKIQNKKTWDIKEWKEPLLDLVLEIEYYKYTPTIKEITEWHDREKAIQYLKEHGLSITK